MWELALSTLGKKFLEKACDRLVDDLVPKTNDTYERLRNAMVEQFERDRIALLGTGADLIRFRQANDAVTALTEAKNKEVHSPVARLLLAVALNRKGDDENAGLVLAEALYMNPFLDPEVSAAVARQRGLNPDLRPMTIGLNRLPIPVSTVSLGVLKLPNVFARVGDALKGQMRVSAIAASEPSLGGPIGAVQWQCSRGAVNDGNHLERNDDHLFTILGPPDEPDQCRTTRRVGNVSLAMVTPRYLVLHHYSPNGEFELLDLDKELDSDESTYRMSPKYFEACFAVDWKATTNVASSYGRANQTLTDQTPKILTLLSDVVGQKRDPQEPANARTPLRRSKTARGIFASPSPVVEEELGVTSPWTDSVRVEAVNSYSRMFSRTYDARLWCRGKLSVRTAKEA